MLVNATEMLLKARDGHYGVPQFNINNLEWTKAVLTACEQTKSPVILGVSEGAGKYMTGFKTVAAMVKAMVDSMGITVPVALHLDHGTYEGCKACVEAGFSSIMFDGSHYPIEENVEKTKELVALAHANGMSIEAEVGSIGGVEDGVVGTGEIADPAECARITDLGIDFLAAGIGNIHGVYPANWKGLDFEALDRIHKATNNIPSTPASCWPPAHRPSSTSARRRSSCSAAPARAEILPGGTHFCAHTRSRNSFPLVSPWGQNFLANRALAA